MSSKLLFAGRQWLGRQFLPSLFTGVGTFTPVVVKIGGVWTEVSRDLTWTETPRDLTWS